MNNSNSFLNSILRIKISITCSINKIKYRVESQIIWNMIRI